MRVSTQYTNLQSTSKAFKPRSIVLKSILSVEATLFIQPNIFNAPF